MAKRNRENALRERRLRKQARKEARKLAAAEGRTEEVGEVSPFDENGALIDENGAAPVAENGASPVAENGSEPLAVPEEDAKPEG